MLQIQSSKSRYHVVMRRLSSQATVTEVDQPFHCDGVPPCPRCQDPARNRSPPPLRKPWWHCGIRCSQSPRTLGMRKAWNWAGCRILDNSVCCIVYSRNNKLPRAHWRLAMSPSSPPHSVLHPTGFQSPGSCRSKAAPLPWRLLFQRKNDSDREYQTDSNTRSPDVLFPSPTRIHHRHPGLLRQICW